MRPRVRHLTGRQADGREARVPRAPRLVSSASLRAAHEGGQMVGCRARRKGLLACVPGHCAQLLGAPEAALGDAADTLKGDYAQTTQGRTVRLQRSPARQRTGRTPTPPRDGPWQRPALAGAASWQLAPAIRHTRARGVEAGSCQVRPSRRAYQRRTLGCLPSSRSARVPRAGGLRRRHTRAPGGARARVREPPGPPSGPTARPRHEPYLQAPPPGLPPACTHHARAPSRPHHRTAGAARQPPVEYGPDRRPLARTMRQPAVAMPSLAYAEEQAGEARGGPTSGRGATGGDGVAWPPPFRSPRPLRSWAGVRGCRLARRRCSAPRLQ